MSIQSNTMPARDVAAIRRLIEQAMVENIASGVVFDVTPDGKSARVRASTNAFVTARIAASGMVKPGDTVVMVRLPQENYRWIVLTAYAPSTGGASSTPAITAPSSELAPPAGFSVTNHSGAILASWQSPPQRPDITFEVAVAEVGDEENALTYFVSGSHFILVLSPGQTRALRVRSVAKDWTRSGWSPWEEGTAQSSGAGTSDHGDLTGLLDDDHPQYLTEGRGDLRYATASHNHDESYAPLVHDHDTDYAPLVHNHDADYAPLVHDHNTDYAAISHTHVEADITDLNHDAVSLQGNPVAVTTPDPGDVLAWNGTAWEPVVGSSGGVSDHGALTGLGDDDHPQYHNDARGDARYSLLGHDHDDRYFRENEYLSSSAGTPDAGKPIVLNSSGKVDDTMLPAAQTGVTELNDLDDVDLSVAPQDGQALVYDGSLQIWKAETITGGGGVIWNPDLPPEVPNAIDHEFDSMPSTPWFEHDPNNVVSASVANGKLSIVRDPTVPYAYGWWRTLPNEACTITLKARVLPEGATTLCRLFVMLRNSYPAVDDTYDPMFYLEPDGAGGYKIGAGTSQQLGQNRGGERFESTEPLLSLGDWVYVRFRIPTTGNISCDASANGIDWETILVFANSKAYVGITAFNMKTPEEGSFTSEIEFFRYQSGLVDVSEPVYGQEEYVESNIDHGTLIGLTDDDHPQYHNDARGDARYSLLGHDHDDIYFRENEYLSTSSGATDAGKPVVLGADGKLDETFLPSGFSGEIDSFIELFDTPDTYIGTAGKIVAVNSLETALEFVDPPISGALELDELLDVDLTTPPSNGQALIYDSTSGVWQAKEIITSAPLTVEEADSAPSVENVNKIVVTNGTLTNNGNGQITLDFGSAATDGSAIHDNVSGEIAAITEKIAPISTDVLLIEDSEAFNAKKRVQIGNLPSGSSGGVELNDIKRLVALGM